ncbi:MAG: arginine--tRNA ligase [Anaerolineae bacterium]|nr:arginine--tRNA ligase [Anaerolineae bacterium]
MKLLPKETANLVTQAIKAAQSAGDLPEFDIPAIPITPTKHESHGDYACPVAMGLAKSAKMKPRAIAEIIIKHLPHADFIEKFEIAGSGFINFYLSSNFLKQQVEAIISEGENLFTLDIGIGKKAQVEFVSANPTGPIHIGRTRGGVIGDTMARLLEAAGYDVQREYYFNNAGNQMRILGESLKVRYLQELGQDVELDDNHYQGDYLIDYAKELVEQEKDALVDAEWVVFKEFVEQKMFKWIRKSLKAINIEHDNFFNEDSLFQNGDVWETLAELEANGYVYEAIHWKGITEEEKSKSKATELAKWFETTKFGDEKDRVMVKADGVPTYTLPDIAYHRNKVQRGFDVMVNVLGADHGQQYKTVAWGMEALGLDPTGIHVILNQFVRTVITDPKTGEKVEKKGSTRRGEYDTLDDLVEWTSADAVRYHLLAYSPTTHITFDVGEVIKQNNENPVYYIQNAHVRCCGIFREAAERGFTDDGADMSLLGEDELKFIRKAVELGRVIEAAVESYEPHKIAFYGQDLAGVFHPIYDKVRVLHTEVPQDVAKARLRFYKAAQVVFHRVLSLMGMTTPERM